MHCICYMCIYTLTALEQLDSMPEMGDEADVPIIVPPPGQILRRTARTRIRKPGLPADGASHRFGSARRPRRSSGDGNRSTEQLSNENGDSEGSSSRRLTLSDDGLHSQRPDSFSEEASIFDAYVRDDDDDVPPIPILPTLIPKPSPTSSHPEDPPRLAQPEIQPSLLEALGPILDVEQPQPQQPILTPTSKETLIPEPSRTPSPEPVIQEIPVQPAPIYPQQPFTPAPPSAIAQPVHSIQQQLQSSLAAQTQQQSPPRREKEKDKKGLFKWGSDKSGKKSKGEKEKEKEKEKDNSFFGSLFGGGKKKQEDSSQSVNTAGREAAQALLGASKSSKNYVPPTSPGLAPGTNNFSRYPIHVERAIYRLSHIKLANPRRPLYEQVLISNLMFWYLGVINKAQSPATPPASENGATPSEKEQREREQKEKEQKEKAEKEKLERERLEKEQKERELEMKKKESGRRGSLTKTPAGGSPGGRRAEMPVKGPQYEKQQQVMQKEYSNGYNGQQGPRAGNPPGMMNGPNGQPYQRSQTLQPQQQYPPQNYPSHGAPQYPPGAAPQQFSPQQMQVYPNSPPKHGQPQLKSPDQFYYDNGGSNGGSGRGGLPPGAMPPANMSPGPQQRSPKTNNVGPQLPPSNRGPYPPNNGPGDGPQNPNRGPTRSLSANAIPNGPQVNGNLRKGNSAHAVVHQGRPSEEDDTPLAVYQQQQRR